jgi:hypothetical protein
VIICSLPPLIKLHVYYFDDGLRWLIIDEHDYITIMIYLSYSTVCLLNVLAQDDHLYSCIIYMAKIIKVKYLK